MTITSYQVQNILRTYAKQLSRGQRLARTRAVVQQARKPDQVNISIEARRKQVIERITAEIVGNLGSRVPGLHEGFSNIDEQALERLSAEYGQSLDVSQNSSGDLSFKVVDRSQGVVVKTLGAEESSHLQERLYQITQDIIDRTML